MLISNSDCVLKTYNSGKMEGIIVLYLVSDKAKKIMIDNDKKTLTIDDNGNILFAGLKDKRLSFLSFIERNGLRFEEIIIN